nr:KilA-N domain-containing protein [Hafnia alvei]
MTNAQLIISDITIHQDSEGRYSINDLHKASGGELRHAPAQYLRLDQVSELVQEIINMQICTFKPISTQRGRKGGTYVCKELVYSYAMWVSPRFHLTVIHTYDALVTAPPPKTTTNQRTPLRDAINMLVGKRHYVSRSL